jgi:hypothetical protein
MILYKYFNSENVIKVLKQNRIYFTPPEYFNDINEMSPYFNKNITHYEYIKYFYNAKYIEPLYERFVKDYSSTNISYDSFKIFAKKNKNIINSIIDTQNNVLNNFKIEVNKIVGVCCFSLNPLSNLMWSHYADSHRGVCIGFKYNILQNNVRAKVNYQKSKLKLPSFFMELGEADKNQHIRNVLFTKSKEWKYENEYRIITELKNCKTENIKDLLYYYHELDVSDIQEIIFGFKCDLENEIRNIIDDKKIMAKKYKCMQQEKTFVLKRVQIL